MGTFVPFGLRLPARAAAGGRLSVGCAAVQRQLSYVLNVLLIMYSFDQLTSFVFGDSVYSLVFSALRVACLWLFPFALQQSCARQPWGQSGFTLL